MLSKSEEFGDGDIKLDLSAFQGPDDITSTYISPWQDESGQAKPNKVPSDKRIEALVRIPITVQAEMECLSGQFQSGDEGHAFYNQRKGPTAERVRSLDDMPYFGLPDVPPRVCKPQALNDMSSTEGRSIRVSKSKYNMPGCIGASLGDSEYQRNKLSDEARRQLIDQAGTKWLELVEDWAEPFFELPAWMRPDAMDIDNTRKIQSKDLDKPQRQSIKFEAVWLDDFPGDDPDLGPRCRQFWADPALRDQFGIPTHAKHTEFAVRGKRPELRDPRDFRDYSQWQDGLRVSLFFTAWKLNFDSAWLIDRKLTKSATDPDILAGEVDDFDAGHELHCIKILDASGADPPLDFPDFLGLVEKG